MLALTHRLATLQDLPALKALMELAIRCHIGKLVSQKDLEAHFDHMGVDTQLIEDGTYFVVECDDQLAGCGGWGKRATLFGGDHSKTQDAALLDPATDAARIRAMYTHPDFARRGVGRHILTLCEDAARTNGFKRLELFATLSGEPLYASFGFHVLRRKDLRNEAGATVSGATMVKSI